jgi:GR25 family glycosyltransferase involved in LPS biosynthesis
MYWEKEMKTKINNCLYLAIMTNEFNLRLCQITAMRHLSILIGGGIVFLFLGAVVLAIYLFLLVHRIRFNHLHVEISNQAPQDMSACFSDIPIYYINLDRATGRRKRMEYEIRKYSIPNVTRICAVDAKRLSPGRHGKYEDITYEVVDYVPRDKKTRLACTLSHLLAIQTAYYNNDQFAIVCEDDVSFNLLPHWTPKSIDEVISKAPVDWTNINLCTVECALPTKSAFLTYATQPYILAAMYLLNRKGMRNILKHMTYNHFVLISSENGRIDADWILYVLSEHSYAYVEHCLIYTFAAEGSQISGLHNSMRYYAYRQLKAGRKQAS